MAEGKLSDFFDLGEVTFVHRVNVGNINPNNPLTEEQLEAQVAVLNKCLNSFPKGRIIGREVATALFRVGDHEISMQRITYHVGFKRIPFWLTEEEKK